MGGVGCELPLTSESVLQPRDHFVEGAGQPPDLVIGKSEIKALAEVLGRNPPRQAGQPVDG
jgi:hypothetical protein